MTVLHTGATRDYSENWARAFGGPAKSRVATQKKSATKKSVGKSAPVKKATRQTTVAKKSPKKRSSATTATAKKKARKKK